MCAFPVEAPIGSVLNVAVVGYQAFSGVSLVCAYSGPPPPTTTTPATTTTTTTTTATTTVPPSMAAVRIFINYDDYATETTFVLEKKNSQGLYYVIKSVGAPSGNSSPDYSIVEGLGDGDYRFTIDDSFGDGICCDYGIGGYSLTDVNAQNEFAAGGEFGLQDQVEFSVLNGFVVMAQTFDVTITIVHDNYPEETSWTLKSSSGEILASQNANSGVAGTINEIVSVPGGMYTFAIEDSYGDGICCSYGLGSFSIAIDGTTIQSGGDFGESDSFTFSV